MDGRFRRFAATAATAFVLAAGTMVLGAGTANASQPVVIGDCATTVKGAPGTPVKLRTSAVLAPVTNTVSAIPVLGPPLAGTVKGALTSIPPIPIGALPTGSGVISGGQIAHDVVGKLPVLGAALKPVLNTLSGLCGVTMHGVNAAAAPVQDGTKSLADKSRRTFSPNSHTGGNGGSAGTGGDEETGPANSRGAGGTSDDAHGSVPPPELGFPKAAGALGGVPFDGSLVSQLGLAESPAARYNDIPFATPGLFAPSPGIRYGGTVPGYSPQFDVLGKDQRQDKAKQDNPVRTAGHAEAIGTGPEPGGGGVGLALLLAVLTLSGVSAALVRTWILRSATSAAVNPTAASPTN